MQQAPTTHSTGGFTVREARPEDLAQATALITRVLAEDLGISPLRPEIHFDVIDPRRTYLDNPRHALFIAVDDTSGEVIGTTGVRAGGPKSPPHPRWLADKYDPVTTAQLYRVYIHPEHRRRGAARHLVEAARRFIAAEGGYAVIYLHTDPVTVPAAEPFWRSMPATEIYDARGKGEPSHALHFELAFPGGE